MKRFFFLAAIALAAAVSCQQKPELIDYADASNWLKFENNPTHEVDLFYILPTIIKEGEDSVEFFSEEDKASAVNTFNAQASALEPLCNVYAPFYRQVPLNIAFTTKGSEDYARLVRTQIGKLDVFAALDYYFENVNNGRPFFLASHSQGTAMTRAVLSEYMKDHPEYYSRMIADYALGYSLPKSWFAANPHIKPATDELGTGVVIGWNLEGPGATGLSMVMSPDDYVINPLSWSTDTAYVSAEANLGSIVSGMNPEIEFKAGVADAQIDPQRPALICTYYDQYVPYQQFGDKSLHTVDWGAYYMNIRDNARKRAEAYLGHELQ